MNKILTPLGGAFLCGATPVVFGTALLLTWLTIQVNIWERAWLWAIGLAIPALLAGVVFWLRDIRLQRQSGVPHWKATWLAAAVLLVNIPLAVLYMFVAIEVTCRYTVEIQNTSAQPVETFLITGPGVVRTEVGPIQPGAHAQKHLELTGDGRLDFMMKQGGQEQRGTLDGSAGPTCGGRRRVWVKSGGICEVEPLHPFGQREPGKINPTE